MVNSENGPLLSAAMGNSFVGGMDVVMEKKQRNCSRFSMECQLRAESLI